MPTIFLPPYKSELLDKAAGDGCGKAFAPLHEAIESQTWPYDNGDDPSFYCRKHKRGALTWGVCRADVRHQARPGDIVVFFAFTKNASHTVYRICAVATVERKIQQSAIFGDPGFAVYREYLNLLVKPDSQNAKKWEHSEPGAPPSEWHPDWLNRVAMFGRYSGDALKKHSATNSVNIGESLDGKPFYFGDNYVIFSREPSLTLVLEQPPIVAEAEPPIAEVWRTDSLSKEIWKRTFVELRKHKPDCLRTLRLDNKIQQPHSPPARWTMDHSAAELWRKGMMEYLLNEGLGRF